MKKNWKKKGIYLWISVIIFLFMAGASENVYAQKDSIIFSKTTWKKQLNQAKREKKLIFLDCHTQWCGFCKILAQYVFTDPEVAKFYNQHFINVEMDMEEGIGIELRKKYHIMAYPTLLFINAQGELEHYHAGYLTPKELIGLGEQALDLENNLAGMQKRYTAGERNPVMLKAYLQILTRAYQDSLMCAIVSNDVGKLEDQQFYTPEVWEIIEANKQAALPLFMERIIPDREQFYQVVGKERVDQVIDDAFTKKAIYFIQNSTRKSFASGECKQMVEFLLNQDILPYAGEYLAAAYVAEYLHEKQYSEVLNVLKDITTYHFFRQDTRDDVLNFALRYLAKCDNMEIKKGGVEILDALPATTIREKKKPMYDATRKILLEINEK